MSALQTPRIQLGPAIQVGIVVRDAIATAQAWLDRFELEPMKVVDFPPEGVTLAHAATYRGTPADFCMRLVFLQAGPVQLEFIQPLAGDSLFTEFLAQHGEGLHHLLFEVDDPEAVAAGLAAPILQSGSSTLRPGALWAYLDTQDVLGVMVELRTKLR